MNFDISIKYLKLKYSILFISFTFFVVTAINNHGYFHADEHYQIIEFAGLKLGTHSANELAWEYNAGIRSAFQPFIAYIILSICKAMGVDNPYTQLTIFRLLSALLSFLAILLFSKEVKHFIHSQYYILYLFIAYLLWFIPMINVRFSSETWSGIFLLFSLCSLKPFSKKDNFLLVKEARLTGIFIGLSFLCRFQIAIAFIFVIFWLIIIKKEKIRNILIVVLYTTITIVVGVFIDYWFYGKFTLTVWNYFNVNIIQKATSNFGISPFYEYVWYILKLPSFPIGLFILFSFIYISIKFPKFLFVWIIIPFIIIHSFIGHKEARFLFPIANLVPMCILVMLTQINFKWVKSRFYRASLIAIISFFLIINFLGLITQMFKTAGSGRMELTRYIYKYNCDKSINLISTNKCNPYNPFNGLPTKFYIKKNINFTYIHSLCELNDSIIQNNRINFLIFRKEDLNTKDCKIDIESKGFEKLTQSIPGWIIFLNNKFYGGFKDKNLYYLYKFN